MLELYTAATPNGYKASVTLEELGLKGFEMTNWYGLMAPGATPRAIRDRWRAPMASTPMTRTVLISSRNP